MAEALGLLGHDLESVEHMIHVGVCSVFAKILKEGPMKGPLGGGADTVVCEEGKSARWTARSGGDEGLP
ncbi:hypothetical protein ACFXTN_029872 [Malus domestica]